ncbi:MAG: LptF/LptG family permease [Planctomycetota bacterium]
MKARHLPLMGRLDRYVVSHFVGSYATALFLLVGLFLIMDLTSNLDDYLETNEAGLRASNATILRYYLLKLPFLFLEVAPFVTLVAGMFTVNKLLKRNEVAPVLSAGLSVHRLLVPVFLCGLLLAFAMFSLREVVVSRLANQRDALLFQIENPGETRDLEGVAVHDLSGSTIFLEHFYPDERPQRFENLSAVLHDGRRTIKIDAPRAHWDRSTQQLVLEDGRRNVISEKVATEKIDRLDGFQFSPDLALTYYRSRNPRPVLHRSPGADEPRAERLGLQHPLALPADLPPGQPGAAFGGPAAAVPVRAGQGGRAHGPRRGALHLLLRPGFHLPQPGPWGRPVAHPGGLDPDPCGGQPGHRPDRRHPDLSPGPPPKCRDPRGLHPGARGGKMAPSRSSPSSYAVPPSPPARALRPRSAPAGCLRWPREGRRPGCPGECPGP